MAAKMKINIAGECTVYKNDKLQYPIYYALLSNKRNDVWESSSIQLAFPMGTNLKNDTPIKINRAFLSFYKRSDNTVVYQIKIVDFELIDQAVGEINIPISTDNDSDAELPF